MILPSFFPSLSQVIFRCRLMCVCAQPGSLVEVSVYRYTVCAINGTSVQGSQMVINGREWNVMDYLSDEANFPVIVRFMPPMISTNEKIILSSTFHSLFTIAAQLSPIPRSSGIEVLTTTQFKYALRLQPIIIHLH